MSDLRSVTLKSLGTPQGNIQKKKPIVKIKRKKRKVKKILKPKEKEVVDERERLKRSKTTADLEADHLEQQAVELRSDVDIMREKAESLSAESESKDLLIYQLRTQLAEAEAKLVAMNSKEGYTLAADLESRLSIAEAAVLEKEAERAEWEAQAISLVEEGNAAIEETHAELTASIERYNQLVEKNQHLRENAGGLEEELEDRDALLERQERRIMSLSSHRNDVKLTEETAIIMLEQRESRLVAAMATLEESQKRCEVYKKRESKVRTELEKTKAALDAATTENEQLTQKWVAINQGNLRKTSSVGSSDESQELGKLRSSNTMLEFNMSGLKEDLAKEKKERIRLESSVNGIIKQRDDLKESSIATLKKKQKLINKLKETVTERVEEIEELKKIVEKNDARVAELQDRATQRHNTAMARAEEDKKAAVETALNDYTRIQMQNIDLEMRFKEVCEELDDRNRSTMSAENISALKAELTKCKESYAAVVEKNQKWATSHKEVTAKNSAWKKAEVAWIADKSRMEEEILRSAQRAMILESKLEAVPEGGAPPMSKEYLATVESLAGGFVVNFENMMRALDSINFQPNPILLDTFGKFPAFKAALMSLMASRANGTPFDTDALATAISFIGTDLSQEIQPVPLENVTSIYHPTMSVLENYVSIVKEQASFKERLLLGFEQMRDTINGVTN